MGDRINNVNKMMQNPQQRNMYLAVVGLAVVTLIAGVWFATRGASGPTAAAGANVAAVPNIEVIPGAAISPQYNLDIQRQNELLAAAALAEGGTFIPTPVSPNIVSNVSPIDELQRQRELQAAEEARVIQLQFEEAARIRNAATQVTVAPAPLPPTPIVEQQVSVPKYNANDHLIVSTLLGVWAPRATVSEFNFAGQIAQTNNAANQPTGEQAPPNQQVQQGAIVGGAEAQGEATTFKAGTIHQAILETSINSDEVSPVLARIVSGPLAGTRLLGGMQLTGERVLVEFSTASIPGQANSLGISAVAVDPNTARTALVSDVDRHFFLRYGILLASVFLGGYADAIARQNTTTTVSPDGGVVQTTGQLSSRDISRQAIGSVGKALSQQIGQQVQGLRPTVTVDSGTAIGVLLMTDLAIQK